MSQKRTFKECNNEGCQGDEPPSKRQRVAEDDDQTQDRTVSEQILYESSKMKRKWNECTEAIKFCVKTELIDEIINTLITFCQPPSFIFTPDIEREIDGFDGTANREISYKIMDNAVSDYSIIACGYCERLINDIKSEKETKFKDCLFINSHIYHWKGSFDAGNIRIDNIENKACIIDEGNGDAQFVMDAMNEMEIDGSEDCVVFRNPAPLEELMASQHCGCFGHYELYKIQYMEYLGKRIVALTYDTESG